MEEQDRKKRLLAGKEKLAAFQRKRGKKKKSSPVDSETASEMASKGHGLQSGHSSSLIDPCDLGFTSEGSLSIDESDQGSVTDGDLTEEEDGSLPFVSLERTRLKLEKASERIRELEESVQGKQGALDELAAENALLKAHAQAGQHGNSTQGKGDAPQQQPDQDAYKYKLEEYDEVLKAKDGVIEQLTEALQASNFEKEQAQKESMAQASQLADEIHRLQQQLKQSSELLDHQLGLPAQALIEAKNEILALQNSLDVKDMEVESMTEAIRQRDVALKQLAEKYQEVSQHLSAITEQNAVLSQVSEDQEHWHGKQQQWSDMEHHLKKENAKYMAEIEALRDSLRQRDSSITELNASMSAVTSEKSARITQLEVNIGAYEKEISSLKDHISCTEGEMQQELISLKDVISKKDSTIVDFERQLAELSKACADKDASYAHLQSELHLREEEILSLKGNISSSRKEIDELLSQNDELRSANGTLSVEITNLRSDLSEKESTLQDLIQRSDSAAQQSKLRVAELERSCAEYREEINQHMDDLSLNCREINDLNQQFDQLKEECSKYREENQALKDTVTRKDSELEQLHKSLLDSSDEKEQRITHLMSEVSESTQEIGRLQKTLQSCEMEIKELTNAKDQVNSEKLKCMEEILTLKVTVSETDSRFENLKLQLETSEREHENVVSRLQAEVVSLQENVSSLQENKLCDEKALEEMKERQSVHESKISNLRSALSQKEETVVSLEGELDIKTAKVGDLESSLTRKCEELSQLQEVLSGKESGISEVTALLSQKEKHVRVLEQQIKEKDTEMLSLSQGISNTDTKLYEAQIELERKDCEMQRVVQEVAAKESDCTDLRNRLEDNTYQLEKLSAARDQKESSIKALSADLAEKENTCRDLELELKKVKKNLQECQVDIAEKNATCESLRKELHQKDSSLSDLTITLERKQKSILDLQKCLDEATSKIAQLEKAESEKVLNLEKVLDEKEDIMTDLRFRLSDLSGQNADLDSDNKSLKENVCSLLQVEDQLRQVQNDVSNLREELAAKNTTVEESRDTIESLNLQINSLQSEYDGMLEEKKELRRLLEESKEELQRSADKLKSEKDELQNVLAVSQRDYDRIAESLAAVQAEKQKLVDHIESLQFQKLELTSSKEILMSEKEDLLVKTEEINSQLSDQSSASDTLVFEKDELLIKLDSLETENMQLCEKSAELASEKLELEKELSAKQTALSALQEQVSQLQAELKETSDHRTALQKNYDEKCQELTTIHLSLNEKTQALNALEVSVESRLATSVQEAVENATQNYVRRIEELTGEIKDLKNRENEATCTQESLEQKVARLSDSWTVVEGVEAKHQAVDKVMLESGTSLGSSQSAESMESGSEERKPISPVMRGALQTSTSSSSSAQDGRLQELETEVVRLQAILHDRERTVLDSTKGATQQLKKKNEQIKGLNEKTEKQAAQIKTMKERATVMKNDLEALKVKYAALQSQLKTRGVKVTIPQKLEAAIKEKVAEINRLNEQIEIRDAQILTLNVELRKRPDEAEPSTSDAGTSGQKMEPSLNGDAENKIQRIREENSVLVEKLQLITSEHDSAYRSVKVENNILSEQLAEERKLFEKEKATFEEEKKRWELNIRSLSGRHQELYQQTATSNLDILTQLERLKAENAQFKSQVDELSTKLAIHVSRDDEVARLKEDLTKHSRNHELVKMELQAARTSLYELESRNPDVLVYRRKLDDLHATLQVTWIENEELKAQVMQLKYQLGLDAENDEAADEPDGQSNVARQIQKLKLEHAAQTEKLTNELETVKAKAKEIEIEKDSLHTKYQQEIRVKEKEHLNVLNELTRQLEHTRSVLDSLRSEYRHSQQQIQKLEDEKEAMQKSYGQAVEAMRREHQETLHRVRSQAEKSGRTVMVPLKENASADMQVRARLNLLMDEKIKLSKERDQLISERQDLILERELMLAEKMQLVADKDKLAAENAELQDQQQKLGAEGNTGLAKPEQLVCDYEKNLLLKQRHEEEMQALRENLNDGHRAEILLLKKTIISILNEEIRKQMESSEQLLQQIMGSSSHPEVTRAQQMLHAQHVGQLDQLNSRLTEHGILSIRGDETASDMQKMVRYLQQQNQELAEAKETLLERTDAHTPLDRSFAELSDQDSLDIMQRSLEHDGLTEHGDSISMHDSLEDYSEADFRAQIDVLQRENADLRRRIEGDYRNLNVVHSLKKEVVGLQAKYLSVMQRSAIHMRDIDSASQDEDSESLVTPPQREAFEPEIDWKKKYEDLTKETEMLRGRIDALTLSHQLSTKSQSVENLKARYESIMEENEVLRAKLGSYGLPTEGTPEEDSFDLQTKFEAVMKENETLRTKLDNYSMSSSSSQQRDEDWKSKFDCVLKDLDSLKPKSMSMADFGKVGGDVKQGLYELQGFYDSVVKEKEVLQVKLESVQDNAEKEFADLLTRYKQLLHKHQEVREKWKRTIEKSRKERSKLKARFVAALKEINILKQRLDRIPKGNVEETSSSSSEIEVDQPLYDEQKQQIDGLKSKVSTLQAENSAMKSEIGNLKSQAMGSLRRQLREMPESSDDVSEDVYESLQDKYTSACKEIEYLRSQLDAINGRLLDDLNSEVKGDTDSKPVHSQLAYLKAAGMGDSISESVEFMSTDPHDSDSDTSGDSLDLEMETDYEVLVQEYERLRTQGPAEIQQEYEAVLRRLNLQDVFNSPKRKALNVSDPKECKSDPISSEAQITKGSSSSIVSQRSRQQQLEGLTALPGDNMQDQTIDKQSQPLETLKAQYEEEVEQLRLELEQAKHGDRSSAADHSKKEPKPVGPTSHDGGQHNHEQVTNHHGTTTDYSTQIEEIKKTFQIELSTALEAQKQTLEESHRSQLDDLRKQLKDESASELEAQMLSLEKSHKAQLDELRIRLKTEFEEDMERKEQALQEAHQQELKAMEGEWMRSDGEWLVKIEELNSQHKKELAERARGTPAEDNSESFQKRLAEMKESLQQEFEVLKGQLLDQHAAAMEAAEEEHHQEIDRMREQHILEMAGSRQDWAATNGHRDQGVESPDSTINIPDGKSSLGSAKDTPDSAGLSSGAGDYSMMLEKLQQERDDLEKERNDFAKQLQQEKVSHQQTEEELEKLRQEHLEHLDDLRVSIQEELLVENQRKLDAMADDLQNAHAAELEKLREELAEEYQAQINALRSSLKEANYETEKLREDMEEKHKKEIEELRRQLEEAAENQSAESVQKLKELHSEQLSAAELDTDVAKSELEEAHAWEMQRYKEKLEDLQQEHQLEKQELTQKISDLQQQLISSHGDHDIIEELQQQRNKLKETLSQRTEEVQELTDQLDDSKDRVSELEKRIEYMERQVHEHAESTNAVSEQNKKHEESDMLEVAQQELSTANSEREYLKLMNERLRNVLSETVMTTMTTEERINRQLANLVAEGRKSPSSRSRPGGSGGGDSGADAGVTDDEPTQDGSTLSMFSDEGLDLSQRISESLFVGPDIDSDNDFVYDATNRLQAGVEHILDMITTATRQLHEAQATQRSLVDTLSERNQEIVELQNKLEDQENKFKQEAETREFLAVELNKAEGLLEGYVSEKKQLEETLRTMEEEKETLVADLETARAQLHGFVDSEADLTAREDHIQRQTLALEQSIGQEEQDLVLSPNGTPRQRSSYTGLLQENAKLSTEKRDLEKQFQHEAQMLQRRISEMEMNEHDIQAQYEHQLQEKKIEIEDLQRQIQNLDKKVKSNQQFIEEQSAEREQEREESQQEIRMLKDIVKEKEKHQTTESRLQREWSADLSVELDQLKELYEFSKTRALASDRKVQDLEDHLKEKIDAHSELRLKYEQLERDIQGLQVVLRERESLIKQLEEELDAKHQAENDFTDKLKKLEQELARQQEANIELTAELRDNINADELQQAVKDLEAQLEHARTSERLSQERCRQLEEELKNLKTLEEELKADKEVLQKQVYDQLNHISTLKLQVEDMKLNIDQADSKAVKELRQILAQEREALESKDKEMSDLSSQLEQFREQVVDKNDEIQQMAAQLKVTDTKHQHRLVELEELYTKLTEENGKLKKQIADLKAQPDSSPISTFAQNLIDNKNEEIDELNRHVKQLQEELDHVKTTENSSAVDTLKQEIAEKNIEIETKTIEVKELKEQLNINLTTSEEVVKLQEEVAEKEDLVVNLEGQVNTLQQEVKDLSQCQTKLQDDFDEVQKMLDGKQKEVETLHQQLELVRAPSEGISAEVKTQYETETMKLQEMLRTKEDMIEKKEDEVISLQERLEKRAKDVEHLETQVKLLSERLTVLQQQLEGEGELLSNDRDEEVLLAQLQQQSQLIDDLQNQLSQSRTNFKSRQEEFSRAIAELETQRKLPMQQTKGTTVAGVNVEQLKLQYEAEIVRLKEEHEKEIDRIRHLYEIDDADSTFQMERDLKPELDAHSALDGRFMEHIGRHRQAGVGGERSPKASDNPEMSDRLRGVLQNLRRESQRVYSLSQELLLQSQQQVHPSGLLNGDQSLAAWREERQSLLAANRSLKKLLSASQSGDPSKFAEDEDWRADLLHAVTEVFKAETKNMSAQLAAYRKEAGEGDSSFIEKLEKLSTEQNERQRTALQSLYEADRQSLMSELQELRGRMNGFQHSSFEEQSRIRDELAALDEQFSKREWHLKRQLELMEYKLQQERVLREDLESSLEKEKSRNMEISSQLMREKSTRSDLQGDLADTQAQLTKLRDALEREQNRLISSSNALDEERQRTSLLNESLTQERMSSQQLQEDLDFERQRNQRMKDRNHQLVEKLKRETEMEKERRMEAQDSVERERMTLGSLRRELELERDSSRALDHKAKAKIAELKSSLDMERARTEEMNSALQRERQLNAQLREALDEERSSLHDTSSREKAAITDLQAMLDLERSKLLELHTTVEREKNKVHNLNSKLAAEQSRSAEELEHERATCRQLKNSLETLQAQKQELARQAEFEADKVAALQANAERLQASLMSTKDRLREMESVVENARSLERQRLRDWDQERDQERRKQYDKDTELLRLRQKVSNLELQLAEHKRSAMQAFEEKDLTRLKTTFSSHKRSSRSETESVSSIGNIQTNGAGMAHKWQHRQLESFRQRLNLIMIQTQDEIVKATDRLHSDPQAIIDSIDDLSRLYTRLKDLQAELDKLQPSMIRDVEITSGSVAGLNEKILKHNSELSHLLTTLSEEKHEMYRKSEHLRDEVQELRRQLNNNEIDATDERLGSERVLWSQERATLALQKNNAEKEIVHLKAKIRRLEIELEREREKYIGPQSNGEVADREKMQRLYGKYLKAESFKKSLIYQKKYLLILLGGYQDTERETLSMLAKMGGFENGQFQEYQTRLPPLSRFRSAARVIIACSRMKLLVRKWKRATRVGSQPVVGNMQSTSGASATYLPNANGFSPPRTQQYMSHEDVVESRWTSYSYPLHHTPPTKDNTQTSHNRRNFSRRNLDLTGAFELVQDAEVFHDSGAVSPLTNPDEEHSLNAYIEDLEHIQVRLGQVSQGSLQAQR